MIHDTDSIVHDELTKSFQSLEAVVTEVEVILAGQYLIAAIQKPARSAKEDAELDQMIRAFKQARRRQKMLAPTLAAVKPHQLRSIDDALVRERDRIRRGREDLAATEFKPSFSSVADLRKASDRTLRTLGDLVALAPSLDDEVMPPDGSGGGAPVDPGGGGGGPALPPLPPPDQVSSFDQYPLDIQNLATDAYAAQVEPGAQQAVNSAAGGARAVIDQFLQSGSPTPGTPPPGISSLLQDLNAGITGLVTSVAVSIGGPLGGALAMFSLLVLPRMLDAFEAEIQQALKDAGF